MTSSEFFLPPPKQQSSSLLCVKGLDAESYDQFFTKPDVAAQCVAALSTILTRFDTVLEPSFGNGAFVRALLAAGVDPARLLYFDIDAKADELRRDFLLRDAPPIVPQAYYSRPRPVSCLTIGNPPFGKNSSLAIAFFNRAAEFSDVIAFILPCTFRKQSIQNKLHRSFFLVREETLANDSFTLAGVSYSVPTTFQIWGHSGFMVNAPGDLRPVYFRRLVTPDFEFVGASKSPDLAIRRVGVNAGRIIVVNPEQCSTQSHMFIRVIDRSAIAAVISRIQSLNLEATACKYNTVGCPSLAKSELCMLYMAKITT